MTLKRFLAALTGFLAFSAVPAAWADDAAGAIRVNEKNFTFRSIGGVCQAVAQGCASKVCGATQECCDMPAINQIPCLGPMFKIGAGVADMAEGCKCCKACADCKDGKCTCAKKAKTASIGVGIGVCVDGKTSLVTPKVFTKAIRCGEPCMPVPTCVYSETPLPVPVAPVTFPQPVPMAATQCVPTVISQKVMVVVPKPLHICVAKQEPASEIRKVEWRTESDFLGTAGHLEIHNGDTTVCCEKIVLKTAGCGLIKVCCDGKQVSIDAPCVKGKADDISTDHHGALVLKGHVQITCEKDGECVSVKGSHCSVHLSTGKVEVMMK